MKKILFLLMAAMVLLASCEGPAGRDGFDGEATGWFVKTYTIRSQDWKLINGEDQLNSFFQAKVIIPELTNFIYEEGNVFCYLFQKINGVEVQTMLPFVIPLGDDDGKTEDLWTEVYSSDFSPGSVMFYVNYSDFYTGNRPPDVTFRVVLNW